MAKRASPEGPGRGLAFKPRETDVNLLTASLARPCSSRWCTRFAQAAMAHEDISRCPGLRLHGRRLMEQRPRAFRATSYDLVPKGALSSFEIPKTHWCPVSFLEGWYGFDLNDEFAQDGYLSRPLERSY